MSSCAQIVLKKASVKQYEKRWQEYLNLPVVLSYAAFFATTLGVVFLAKYMPLSFIAIAQMSAYVFVAVLSRVFLKERLSLKKILALMIILAGICLFVI